MKNIKTIILTVLLGILGFLFAASMASAFFGSFEIIIYAVLMVFVALFIDNERRKFAAKGLKSAVFLSAVYIPVVIVGIIVYFCCRDYAGDNFFVALASITGLLGAASSAFTFIAEMIIIVVKKRLYKGDNSKQ